MTTTTTATATANSSVTATTTTTTTATTALATTNVKLVLRADAAAVIGATAAAPLEPTAIPMVRKALELSGQRYPFSSCRQGSHVASGQAQQSNAARPELEEGSRGILCIAHNVHLRPVSSEPSERRDIVQVFTRCGLIVCP